MRALVRVGAEEVDEDGEEGGEDGEEAGEDGEDVGVVVQVSPVPHSSPIPSRLIFNRI